MQWADHQSSGEIFFLEERHKVKTDIEDSIESVSHKVQRQKIKAQSNHGFSFLIDKYLRIEGDWPCYKVNPSNC